MMTVTERRSWEQIAELKGEIARDASALRAAMADVAAEGVEISHAIAGLARRVRGLLGDFSSPRPARGTPVVAADATPVDGRRAMDAGTAGVQVRPADRVGAARAGTSAGSAQ